MAVLGLHFCARAFSSCGKRGPLFIVLCGPLTIVASFVMEHRLQMRRLSSCGSRAQLLYSMWDLPRTGLEPMSPALAGGFSTTAPPGKPNRRIFFEDAYFSGQQLDLEDIDYLSRRNKLLQGWTQNSRSSKRILDLGVLCSRQGLKLEALQEPRVELWSSNPKRKQARV